MAAEKALALVLRTTDWSETSRITTLWTREFGKVRALAKGGRRLRSNFESALDLLTVCSIVLLRKSSGGLDLLTEARVEQRFPQLRKDLAALYAGYYVAEQALRRLAEGAGGRRRRGAPGAEPLRDLLDGAPAAPVALPGELKAVGTQRNTADRAAQTARTGGRTLRGLWPAAVALVLLTGASGCLGGWPATWGLGKAPTPAPKGAVDSMVLRDGALESDPLPADGTAAAELDGARRLFRDKEYAKAEPIFKRLSLNKKNTMSVAEEALYYQAECERLQGRYPGAADLYNSLLTSYPMGRHATEARRALFDIANYWLDDTRQYMEIVREKKDGKRWFLWPESVLHFEKTKPTFDEEGHAVRMLDQVYITDPTGPLAEKALFYLGSVKFFREDYREADHYFSQLVQHHPNGALASKSLQLSIICKQMSTGGSEYDGRLVSEARELVDVAYKTYPDLANNQNAFLKDQLYSITQQQADKDWKIAEFYRRTGHPGSAYFYYDVVRRRYRGTSYEKKALERMAELKKHADEKQQKDDARGIVPPAGPATETAPVPRALTPGRPLTAPETGPVPQVLPPGLNNDRRPGL